MFSIAETLRIINNYVTVPIRLFIIHLKFSFDHLLVEELSTGGGNTIDPET